MQTILLSEEPEYTLRCIIDFLKNCYLNICLLLFYSFIVGGDGRVYEGRGWWVKPAKNKKWGMIFGKSIEIAYMGDHHGKSTQTNI